MKRFQRPRRVPRLHWKPCVASALLALSCASSVAANPCRELPAVSAVEQRKYGVEPAAPLGSRIAPPSADAIDRYVQSGAASARPYDLDRTERAKVEDALAQLPEQHRHFLQAHLRHLSFIDVPAGAGNGLTAVISDGDFPIFDLTLRAGILTESLSEFLTAKEQMAFSDDGSGATVSVEAPGDALSYILLHEATHVVDHAIGVTAGSDPRFTSGIWLDRTHLHADWSKTSIANNAFRRGAQVPISSAQTLYRSLASSPFATLYATAAAPEDFAELVAWRELAKQSSRPLRIVVRDSTGKVTYSLEPLRKARIEERFAEVDSLLGACRSFAAAPPAAR